MLKSLQHHFCDFTVQNDLKRKKLDMGLNEIEVHTKV